MNIKRILISAIALMLSLCTLTSCGFILDALKDALESELGIELNDPDPAVQTTGDPGTTDRQEPSVEPGTTGNEDGGTEPATVTEEPEITTKEETTEEREETDPPVIPPVTEAPGIPYKTMPEIPTVLLPKETFSNQIDREASLVIDGAICRAIGLLHVMRDERHSYKTYAFEEDANGYIAALSSSQKTLYRNMEKAADSFGAFSAKASEYNGDLLGDILDLNLPLSSCRPDIVSYFTFTPNNAFSEFVDKYFDPNTDENNSVKSGDVTMAQVKHDAELLRAVVKRIVAKMPEGLTAYDKYCYLAAVICAQNTYTSATDNCFTAYGSLISGGSVCQGYAGAFYLLCKEANLWCAYRTGTPKGEGHVWNMIKLEDGIYNVDVTWCDARELGSKNWYAYFVKSDADFVKDGHNANKSDKVKGTGVYQPSPYEG